MRKNLGVSAAVLAALATLASASPQESVTFNGIVSNGPDNNAVNGVADHVFTGTYAVRSMSVTGQITEIATADFAGEKIIRVTTPTGQTFVLDPFGGIGGYTGTYFHCGNYRANLPIEEPSAAGNWNFRFSESIDDSGTTGPDATWDTITITLHDDALPPTPEAIGSVAVGQSATRTMSFAGNDVKWFSVTVPDIGGTIGLDIQLDGPADLDTRLAVYDSNGTLLANDDADGPGLFSALSFGASCPTRPNDSAFGLGSGALHNGRDGATLAAGTYYIAVTGETTPSAIPFTGNPFGSGTNQPVAGFGVYGCHTMFGDVTLNISVVEPQGTGGPAAVDLGALVLPQTVTQNVTLQGGDVQWIKFTIPDVAAPGYLDITTAAADGFSLIETEIALYRADGGVEDSDDDDGPGDYSALTYGQNCPIRLNGNGVVHNGRDGTFLAAGEYWLAVSGGPAATFGGCFAASGGTHTSFGDVAVTIALGNAEFTGVPTGTVNELGTLSGNQTVTADLSLTPGSITWYSFTIPDVVDGVNFLDIATFAPDGFTDVNTEIALYRTDGGVEDSDDPDGPGAFAALSYGDVCPPRPNGDGVLFNGRDGAFLAAGTYYLAVGGGPGSTWGTCFGAAGDGSAAGEVRIAVSLGDASDPQIPGNAVDLGTVNVPGEISNAFTLNPGEIKWFIVNVPEIATGANYLDIVATSADGFGSVDTEIAVYRTTDFGVEDQDDNDGPGVGSALTYGFGCNARANGDGLPHNGRDGGLAAGTYLIAVAGGPGTTYAACLGVSPDQFTAGDVVLTLTTGNAEASSTPSAVELGEINVNTAGLVVDDAPLSPGQILWYTFTIPGGVSAAEGEHFDIHTNGSILAASAGSHTRINDTYIRLFREDGTQVSFDDDDWAGFESALSYGTGSGINGGNGAVTMNGRDGAETLTAGRYYIAVMAFPSSLITSCPFGAATTHVDQGTIDLNFITNIAAGAPTCPTCPADFNRDDGVDDLDITDFFAAFEQGDECADVNNDDGIDDLDITDFFIAFEQGC